MKHNISSKIIAVIMAVIMAVGVSAEALAASTTKYICEMVIATGSSLAAAKKKLTSKGYTPISENCSPDFGYTVIGVKTTTDKKQAITDIAVMNMNGKYSFQEYEKVLKKYEDETAILIEELRVAFEEFRNNAEAGNPKAIMAKAMLNRLTDEDYDNTESNKLGDIICNRELTDDELSVIMMQSTDYCITTIESALSLGVSTNWIEAFVNAPSEQIYTAEDYNAVDRIIGVIEPFQDSIKEYEDVVNSCGLSDNAEKEEYNAIFESLSDYDKSVINGFAATYALLKTTAYKNGTLYDFFMKDYDSFEQEDLLPLVKALTPGQLATLPYVGFVSAIQNTFQDEYMVEEINTDLGLTEGEADETDNIDAEMAEKIENLETISIFAGVDRSIFEPGGIALTSDALANINSSNDTSWIKSRISSKEKNTFWAILGVSLGAAAIGGALWAFGAYNYGVEFAGQYAFYWSSQPLYSYTETILVNAQEIIDTGAFSQAEYELLEVYCGDAPVKQLATEKALEATANSGYKLMSAIGKVITGVSLAIFFITAIIYLIKWGKEQKEDEKIEYLEIPRIMVEQKTLDDKSTKYVYYYAAKSLTDNGHSDYGDLNNFKTPQWIALYYTKDTAAGNPVKASAVTLDKAQTSDAKYNLGVHMFNNGGVYDLNPYPKDSLSEASHVYLFFETESSANLTATSMHYGFYAISAVAGLAIGALGMFLIDKNKSKKKAKAESETSVA